MSKSLKEFDSKGTRNLFSDMVTVHLMVGVDLYYPIGLDRKKWFDFEKGKAFFGPAAHVSLRMGLQYMDHVRWLEPAPSWSYWDSSIGVLLAFGFGGVYRFESRLHVSGGLEFLYSDPSPTSDRAGTRASADGLLAVGINLGLGYHF